jgi:hypothetical protein
MTQFARTKVTLEGFDGAPGVNIFNWCAPVHADITQAFVDDFNETLATSFTALTAAAFASGVGWTVDPTVTVHEVDTGDLVGVFTAAGGPWVGTGSGGGDESRATQAGLRWQTNDFRNGRRVQGRTYLGPIASDALAGSGQMSSAVRTDFPIAFEGIYDGLASRLIVWSRPTLAHPVGAYADVVGCTVAPFPFTLRGRRN